MAKILKKIQKFFIYDSVAFETSTGTVYLGVEEGNNSKKLIQVITKLRFSKSSCDALANFVLQINFLKEIFSHYSLQFVDFIETANTFYIVLEAPENMISVKQQISIKGALIKTDKSFFEIFLQMLKGYIPFCARNQPHLNLKTKNLFGCTDLRTQKLIYKISPLFQFNHLETLKEELLDYSYLPLEVIEKISFSSKSDLWSIGVILYEMLSGKNPFESQAKEDVLKKIQIICSNNEFLVNLNLSNELVSFLNSILEPKVEKRANWKDLFRHKFITNQVSLLKNALISQTNEICDIYSKTTNISKEILEAFIKLKEDFNTSVKKKEIIEKIELSGEFNLIFDLQIYQLYEQCRDFYSMKIFDDTIKIQQISKIINKQIDNLSPRKRKSLFVNLDNKVEKAFGYETALLKKDKSSFPKHDILPSHSIKTFPQALKTMIAKYMYQKEIIKQIKVIFDSIKFFSKEMETLFIQFTIAKFAFFRFQYLKDKIAKNQNIFDLPFWDELLKSNEYLNLTQNPIDLFARDHSDSYFALQSYRENNKCDTNLNPSETFFIQFSVSLNQQVFMETDFIAGFRNFMIKFLNPLVEKANNEFIKNKKSSRKYFELALKILELLDFAEEFRLTLVDKDAKWDFEEISQKIESLNVDLLKAETNLKMKKII